MTIILSGRCESKGFWSIGCGTVQFYQFPYHLLERDFDRVLVLESHVYVSILMTHLPLYVLSERLGQIFMATFFIQEHSDEAL